MPTDHAIADATPTSGGSVRRILRDSPVALPWAVLVAALVWDGTAALGTALSGLAALANLWALAWLGGRAAALVQAGRGGMGTVIAVAGVKLPLLVGVLWLLVSRFGPEAVAVGVVSVLFGAVIGAVRGNGVEAR